MTHTLCLPVKIKEPGERVTEVLLGYKKRGFGKGKWNGFGGKIKNGELAVEAAIRELEEESGLITDQKSIFYCGVLHFKFPKKQEWDMTVHIFVCDRWVGKPKETEEMRPKWFKASKIPYSKMWPDDYFWYPKVLFDKKNVIGTFTFADDCKELAKVSVEFTPK